MQVTYYSTAQVAKVLAIGKRTLLGWLYEKRIKEPKRWAHGGQDVRLWTQRDIERVRKFKDANYRKGRGRKKASG